MFFQYSVLFFVFSFSSSPFNCSIHSSSIISKRDHCHRKTTLQPRSNRERVILLSSQAHILQRWKSSPIKLMFYDFRQFLVFDTMVFILNLRPNTLISECKKWILRGWDRRRSIHKQSQGWTGFQKGFFHMITFTLYLSSLPHPMTASNVGILTYFYSSPKCDFPILSR